MNKKTPVFVVASLFLLNTTCWADEELDFDIKDPYAGYITDDKTLFTGISEGDTEDNTAGYWLDGYTQTWISTIDQKPYLAVRLTLHTGKPSDQQVFSIYANFQNVKYAWENYESFSATTQYLGDDELNQDDMTWYFYNYYGSTDFYDAKGAYNKYAVGDMNFSGVWKQQMQLSRALRRKPDEYEFRLVALRPFESNASRFNLAVDEEVPMKVGYKFYGSYDDSSQNGRGQSELMMF